MRNRPRKLTLEQVGGLDLGVLWEPQGTPRRAPGDPQETPRNPQEPSEDPQEPSEDPQEPSEDPQEPSENTHGEHAESPTYIHQ